MFRVLFKSSRKHVVATTQTASPSKGVSASSPKPSTSLGDGEEYAVLVALKELNRDAERRKEGGGCEKTADDELLKKEGVSLNNEASFVGGVPSNGEPSPRTKTEDTHKHHDEKKFETAYDDAGMGKIGLGRTGRPPRRRANEDKVRGSASRPLIFSSSSSSDNSSDHHRHRVGKKKGKGGGVVDLRARDIYRSTSDDCRTTTRCSSYPKSSRSDRALVCGRREFFSSSRSGSSREETRSEEEDNDDKVISLVRVKNMTNNKEEADRGDVVDEDEDYWEEAQERTSSDWGFTPEDDAAVVATTDFVAKTAAAAAEKQISITTPLTIGEEAAGRVRVKTGSRSSSSSSTSSLGVSARTSLSLSAETASITIPPPSAPEIGNLTKIKFEFENTPTATPAVNNAMARNIFTGMPMLRGQKLREFLTDWMRHPVIQDSRIWDISMAGTHNSATWEVGEKGRTLQGFASMFVKCQEKSIYEQLCSGVRFLDLRVLKDAGKPNGLEAPWCAHGSFKTVELCQVYMEVAEFLSDHNREIVILSVRRDQGISTGPKAMSLAEADFWTGLFLGRFLGPRLKSRTTVRELGDRGQQVLYFFEEVERYLPMAPAAPSGFGGELSSTDQTFLVGRLQSSQSVVLSRLDSIFNAPRLPRKLQVVPLASSVSSTKSSRRMSASPAERRQFLTESAMPTLEETGAEQESTVLSSSRVSPSIALPDQGDAMTVTTSPKGSERRERSVHKSQAVAVDDLIDFRRARGDLDADESQHLGPQYGVIDRLRAQEGCCSDSEINAAHSRALSQLKRAKLVSGSQQPHVKTKTASHRTLVLSKFIENLEKGLRYIQLSDKKMRPVGPAGGGVICEEKEDEEEEIEEDGVYDISDDERRGQLQKEIRSSNSVGKEVASMAGSYDGFEVAWKCGTLRLLPPDWQGRILSESPSSPASLDETTKTSRKEIGGYYVIPELVKLTPEDARRFKAMKLTTEFFVHPLEGKLVDDFVFISPFYTGATIIQKSWGQTVDNNPKFLLKKLRYWVALHGVPPPRVPYRFRVLAAEVTPPAPGIALARTELMKFWTGQGLSAAFRLPAGLKGFAQATNRMVLRDLLSSELVCRLNVITHDFCSSRFVLTVLYLFFRSNLTTVMTRIPRLPEKAAGGGATRRETSKAEDNLVFVDEDDLPVSPPSSHINLIAEL